MLHLAANAYFDDFGDLDRRLLVELRVGDREWEWRSVDLDLRDFLAGDLERERDLDRLLLLGLLECLELLPLGLRERL